MSIAVAWPACTRSVAARSPTRSCHPMRVYCPGGTSASSNDAVRRRNREIRMVEDEDRRAHVRVDIAEDLDEPGFVNFHGRVCPRGYRPRLNFDARRQREHVVEKRIVVGKLHRRSLRDREHVRHERLVLLMQFDFRDGQGAAKHRILQVDDDVLDFRRGWCVVLADGTRRIHARREGRAHLRRQPDVSGNRSCFRLGVRQRHRQSDEGEHHRDWQ